VQVGDSGLIHCSNQGNLKYKSPIQSPIGMAVEQGEITEKAALDHPKLNIVSNILGYKDFYAEVSETQNVAPNDTLLLSSDGVLDNFVSSNIIDFICKGNIEDASNNLLAELNKDLKKQDDIGFICVKFK